MSGGLLSCFSTQGILLSIIYYGTLAEDPPTNQYGLNGGSVCLVVTEPADQLKGMKWKFQKDVIVDDKEISPKYKEKVDYNPVNHTLCIKNLMDTDSGIYIANAKKRDWTDSTTSYRLKVLEAVPIPAMQVTYSNSSTGLCNITVNCSDWVFSVCGGGQCKLYQDSLSLSEVNITVSSGNGFIQCTVNNHVSAETKSQRMEDTCNGEKGIAAASPVGTIVGGVTGGLFFIVLVGIGWVISTRRRSCKKNCHWRTSPEVTSIYDTAGKTGTAAGGEEGHPGDKGKEQFPPQSETFYSTVQQPAVQERHPVDKVCTPSGEARTKSPSF